MTLPFRVGRRTGTGWTEATGFRAYSGGHVVEVPLVLDGEAYRWEFEAAPAHSVVFGDPQVFTAFGLDAAGTRPGG